MRVVFVVYNFIDSIKSVFRSRFCGFCFALLDKFLVVV